MRKALFVAIALLLACFAAIAAAQGGGTASKTARRAGAARGSVAASAAAAKLKGKPVVIADISDKTGVPGLDFFRFPQGEQIAIDYINSQLGGLGGRPLKLTSCDSKLEPAATAACARKAAGQHPVTEMGLSILLATNGAKVLHTGNIPTMNSPDLPQDALDADNFPIGGAIFTMVPAMAQYWGGKVKVGSAAYFGSDDPASKYASGLAQTAFKYFKVSQFTSVEHPSAASDLTSYIAKLSTVKPAIAVQLTGGGTSVRFYQTAQQQGLAANKTVNTATAIDADTMKKAGAAGNGAYAVTDLQNPDDTSDPQVRTYLAAAKKYGPKGDPRNYFQEYGFANVMTIYAMAKKIGAAKFDAASLLKSFKGTPSIPIFLGKTMNTRSPIKGLPGLRNTTLQVVQWKNGKFVTVQPFFSLKVPPTVWQQAAGG